MMNAPVVDRRRWLDRWMPWLVALLAVAVAVSVAMSTLAFVASARRVDQINAERVRNTIAGCVQTSRQNQAILDFLIDLGAREQTVTAARRYFPTPTPDACRRQASARIDP